MPGLFVTFEQTGPKTTDVKSDDTTDDQGIATPEHGDLSAWAEQGKVRPHVSHRTNPLSGKSG